MAHFIGSVQGNRGAASRTAGKKSWISARAQGWHIGGEVSVNHDEKQGCDVVTFTLNGGSACRHSSKTVGAFTLGEDGQFVPYVRKD